MSWLPQKWSRTVVPFEAQDAKSKKFDVVATGFLLSYRKKDFLLTCKHVASGATNWYVTFNENGKPGQYIRKAVSKLAEDGGGWRFHKDTKIDLAVLPIKINFEQEDASVLGEGLLEKFENIFEGDEVFFLGFPLGWTAENRMMPVARAGIVALKLENRTFLIDGNIFPGSSGSPIFLRPSLIDWRKGPPYGISKITPPMFIGIVSSYLPYTDIAVSKQTGHPRVTFEENSGLGEAISFNLIVEILNDIVPEIKNEARTETGKQDA
jgi:hypothetical protein